MSNADKMRRALVLMEMAISLLEEVEMDLSTSKVEIEQIRKGIGCIDVVARVK